MINVSKKSVHRNYEKYLDNENVSFEEIFLLYLRMNIYVNNFNLIYEGQPLSQTVERSKL